MKQNSFGIIPLKKRERGWSLLLIKHHAGHCSFPKGKGEKGENAYQTAERELAEEVGLKISSYIKAPPLTEEYHFTFQGVDIHKTVTYFLAIVRGRVRIQKSEVASYAWVPLEEAESHLTFEEARALCRRIPKLLYEAELQR